MPSSFKENWDYAHNLKWILACFQALFGPKINFHKFDLLYINVDEFEIKYFSRIFCHKIGEFPLKYLGVLLHFNKLRREDIQPIIDRIIKMISVRREKHLYCRGKLILLCTCVARIPSYLMSLIKFPKWALNVISSQMVHFWGAIWVMSMNNT